MSSIVHIFFFNGQVSFWTEKTNELIDLICTSFNSPLLVDITSVCPLNNFSMILFALTWNIKVLSIAQILDNMSFSRFLELPSLIPSIVNFPLGNFISSIPWVSRNINSLSCKVIDNEWRIIDRVIVGYLLESEHKSLVVGFKVAIAKDSFQE